jgi:hypothetical protein
MARFKPVGEKRKEKSKAKAPAKQGHDNRCRKKCVWPWFQSQEAIFLSEKRKHKVTHLFNGNFGDFCETFLLG